jgi:uncharacterized protein YsxB (DUF464 family)
MMTIATPADAHVAGYVIYGHARTDEIDWGAETAPVEIEPRRRLSDDEIVSAATTVILVSLVTIIAVAAAAILTMG